MRTPRLRFAPKLRTSKEQLPGWNFDQTNLRNRFTCNPCAQIETYMHTKTSVLELAGSSGAGRVLHVSMKLMTFTDTAQCTDSSPLGETTANTYFLAPFYCSGLLIHCLEISGNKNNLRTIWGWNRQKIKNRFPGLSWKFNTGVKKVCTQLSENVAS